MTTAAGDGKVDRQGRLGAEAEKQGCSGSCCAGLLAGLGPRIKTSMKDALLRACAEKVFAMLVRGFNDVINHPRPRVRACCSLHPGRKLSSAPLEVGSMSHPVRFGEFPDGRGAANRFHASCPP